MRRRVEDKFRVGLELRCGLAVGLEISSMVFRGDWAGAGRRSLYVSLEVGDRRWWIQRWDVGRQPLGRWRSRDGVFGWCVGCRRWDPALERFVEVWGSKARAAAHPALPGWWALLPRKVVGHA